MKKSNFKEKGNPVPVEYFAGEVYLNMLLNGGEEDLNTAMGIVSFAKGARTNWHTHTTGQILIVIEGVGYYQERGKDIQEIKEGELIIIPKEVQHWHGATKESAMRHIAFVPNDETGKKGVTDWLDPVTDELY